MALAAVSEAEAKHHPFDFCGPPILVAPGEPEPTLEELRAATVLDNCSRGGAWDEPENVWWWAGDVEPGTVAYMGIRFNAATERLCEVGMKIAMPMGRASLDSIVINLPELTQAEYDGLVEFFGGGGQFGGNCPVGFWTADFHAGSQFAPSPEVFSANQTVYQTRFWSYCSINGPAALRGDPNRIFAWYKFTLDRFGSGVGEGLHSMAATEAWVVELNEGEIRCGCDEIHPDQCDPSTTTRTWAESMPNVNTPFDANQVAWREGCYTADFDGDGVVGQSDFGIFKRAWQDSLGANPYWDGRADADGDDAIGVVDFGAFKARFGNNPEVCQ
jgi:hypothetical protein